MKQLLLLVFLSTFVVLGAYGQVEPACIPDTTAPKDEPIFPIPYVGDGLFDDTSGIDRPICIGEDYSYTLTINTPATFDEIIPLASIALPVDSAIRVVGEDGTIDDDTPILANGLDYACNPPNCVFEVGETGCLVISGLADFPGPDTISLGIIATLNLAPAGQLVFPFPNSEFPGNYFIEIRNMGECDDVVSTRDLSDEVSFQMFPNPASGYTELRIDALNSGRYQLRMFNMLGKLISDRPLQLLQGQNNIPMNIGNLSKGIYLVSVSDGERAVTRRLVINQ